MEVPARPAPSLRVPVLLGGIATTALTLALSWWLWDAFEFNAMGFYFWYVLPFGALLVGVLAGSGYGVAAWARGVRIGGATLAAVVVLQLIAYGVTQFLEYRNLLSYGIAFPNFLAYFDEATRSVSFDSDDGSNTGELGLLGYGVRLLEVVAFVGGALAIPVAMRSKLYCDDCAQYMRTKALGTLPASVKGRMMLTKSAEVKAEYEAEQTAALGQGMAVHDRVFEMARAGDGPAVAEAVALVKDGTKEANKMPTRLALALASCPACRRGVLSSQTVTGQGKQTRTEALASADVPPEVVRAVLG